MKSRKKIYIEAHKKLVKIYEQGKWTGDPEDCPLCQKFRCEECSLHLRGLQFCLSMKTYNTPIRPQFHREAIKILENLPNKRFRKRVVRKKGFPELWELDEKLGRKI
jgi:hypothetical protein